ncbi:SART-1 protein [Terfezia boudieri ATCC MYA-4762]|uniref:SART-1 protein n=1 Tax=Terfezia boudieri ATCC MYA-4762 TaxID=1051890 RepID=A0A3N4LZ27_9PEZI|nr:SART-1 protein [Terfezia boudieri ATCC MYA-4762]
MPEEQSLSIEETNKLRISLGLKPLPVESPSDSNANKGDADDDTGFDADERRAVANWQKRQDELEKASFRAHQREEIRKAKDAAKRFAKLEGTGLGDEPVDGEEDAVEWVKRMKKRQKKIAKKMAEELAARDAAAQRVEYTEKDVRGLKVAHAEEEFIEAGAGGQSMVLTLKDATIDELEEEGDELENVELGEKERLQKRLELKKKKPVYSAYEEDVDENGERKLLGQYDEEIDPKKGRKKFTLGGAFSGATMAGERGAESAEARREAVKEKLKLSAISLDIEKQELASDYHDLSTVKVKKQKKKKPRSTRRKGGDDDALAPAPTEVIDESAMELDDTPAPASGPKRTLDEVTFVDDEELQNSLTLQRRLALKKRKVASRPEDIARRFKEEAEAAAGVGIKQEEDDDEEPGLIIDETTEFVSNLRAPLPTERRPKRQRSTTPSKTAMASDSEPEDEEGDVDMDRGLHQLEESEDLAQRIKRESSGPEDITSTGLSSEQTLTRGIGATLAMLNQRGLLQRNPESETLLSLHRSREKFQAEKRLNALSFEKRARVQREADRKSGIFEKMSAKEREEYARWENKQRDIAEAKEMERRFKEYKPAVKLEYKDEFGREMNAKEAFKYLSHQFHGKGSGKAKTEKRLKRIDEERKREAKSALQGTGEEGMVGGLREKGKMKGQAGVRLM